MSENDCECEGLLKEGCFSCPNRRERVKKFNRQSEFFEILTKIKTVEATPKKIGRVSPAPISDGLYDLTVLDELHNILNDTILVSEDGVKWRYRQWRKKVYLRIAEVSQMGILVEFPMLQYQKSDGDDLNEILGKQLQKLGMIPRPIPKKENLTVQQVSINEGRRERGLKPMYLGPKQMSMFRMNPEEMVDIVNFLEILDKLDLFPPKSR